MAQANLDRRGIDSILEGFNTFAEYSPIFSVWQGKNLKFQSTDEDLQRGQDLLLSNLEALRQTGSDAIFTIRFHKQTDRDGFVTDKTPYVGSFNFKVAEAQQLGNLAGTDTTSYNPVLNKLDQILQQQNELQSRIAALEETEEEEEDTKQTDIMGLISGIAQTPIGQQIVTSLLGAITRNMAPQQPTQQTVGLAGVPDDEDLKIDEAIERLKAVDDQLGNDLLKLAEIAENNKGMFDMLISSLRKM
jgi:hypothetical protein